MSNWSPSDKRKPGHIFLWPSKWGGKPGKHNNAHNSYSLIY